MDAIRMVLFPMFRTVIQAVVEPTFENKVSKDSVSDEKRRSFPGLVTISSVVQLTIADNRTDHKSTTTDRAFRLCLCMLDLGQGFYQQFPEIRNGWNVQSLIGGMYAPHGRAEGHHIERRVFF